MVAILGNSATLGLIGSLPDPADEAKLLLTEFLLSIFFLAEIVLQVLCDGSLAKYFESGEHVFEFLVQIPSMAKVVAILVGSADNDAVTLLRSLGILRLLRASKYFMFRPIWLMLVRAAESWMPAMNLVVFIVFIMSAWTMLGRELFRYDIDNTRANFDTFFRGSLTLFQVPNRILVCFLAYLAGFSSQNRQAMHNDRFSAERVFLRKVMDKEVVDEIKSCASSRFSPATAGRE